MVITALRVVLVPPVDQDVVPGYFAIVSTTGANRHLPSSLITLTRSAYCRVLALDGSCLGASRTGNVECEFDRIEEADRSIMDSKLDSNEGK
jgi:hypothetical protein